MRRGAAEGSSTAIAIVGLGGRFAGASDLHEYWRLCLEGRDAFAPPPSDRWDHEAFFSTNARVADKSYAPAGAWLDDVRTFPALTLQLPPRRVEVMDPQQRLSLEAALQAVQDAGLRPDELPDRVGVYVGLTASEYRTLSSARLVAQLMASGAFGEIPDDLSSLATAVNRVAPTRPLSATGLLANMTAATIAQELRVTGPAYSVDSACSSALIAAHQAVSALRAGEVDAALVGGVYLCLTPEHHVAFSRIGAMSKSGRCLPFDARADGFVQGEGGAMLLLKRFEDAQRDGDRIYALIHGVALNNDGGGEGTMAPVKRGQVDVIRRAWHDANLSPSQLGYVEAHGTGTLVGDQVEFTALCDALGDEAQRVALGSSKANIGHTMSAAGVAGLVRAAWALHHEMIPPMAGFESPKSELGLESSPFFIPDTSSAWRGDERLAAVSAFGFGGTNAHLVLGAAPQEANSVSAAPAPHYVTPPTPQDGAEPQPELILISAASRAELERYAGALADTLEHTQSGTTVAQVARALRPRHTLTWRAAIVAETIDELVQALRALSTGSKTRGVSLGESPKTPPKVAFLYPGQGSQRLGMIDGIRARFPQAQIALDRADAVTREVCARPITSYLYPDGYLSDDFDRDEAAAALTDTQHCQPALFAVSAALTEVITACGVEPACVAGHSVGEFAAAWAGGVISLEDGARWTATRGREMSALEGDRGAMLAVMAAPELIEPLLVEGAELANINHPRQVVVSGRSEAVERVAERVAEAGHKLARLQVSHAFHSALMSGLPLDRAIDQLELHDPERPVASCIHTEPYADAEAARTVFREHATSPVRFTDTVRQCLELGVTVFALVSAGGPLRAFVLGNTDGVERPSDEPIQIVPMASKRDDDRGRSLLEGLGALFVRGVPVDPTAITAPASPAALPPERLPREPYWVIADRPQTRVKLTSRAEPRAKDTQESSTHASADVASTLTAQTASSSPSQELSQAPSQDPSGVAPNLGAQQLVLSAISQASAYPVDALRPEMSLTDDLGFDSMMMTELVEELRRVIPELVGIPQELLINGATIQDLIDLCQDPSAALIPAEEGELIDDDAPLKRFTPSWVSSPLERGEQWPSAEARLLVASPSVPAGEPIVAALRAAGIHADVHLLGASLPEGAWDGLIYVGEAHERRAGDERASLERIQAWVELLNAYCAAHDASAHQSSPLAVASLSYDDEIERAAICATLKSLSRERPKARIKALSFSSNSSPQERAEMLRAEWGSLDRAVEIRDHEGAREVMGVTQSADVVSEWRPQRHEVIAITGGTRGIGLTLGLKLASQMSGEGEGETTDQTTGQVTSVESRVILIGRSELAPQDQARAEEFKDRIICVRADVCDQAQLSAALSEHTAVHGPVTTLIHAAGVLADGATGQLDLKQSRVALEVKISRVVKRGTRMRIGSETRDRAQLLGGPLRESRAGPLRCRERGALCARDSS